MGNVFNPTATLTKEQQVAKQIDGSLRSAAVYMKKAYDEVRKLVYNNPAFQDEYGVTDANAIYIAFQTNTLSGLTAEQLGEAAKLIKASINKFAPGTIVDDVPEANISYV